MFAVVSCWGLGIICYEHHPVTADRCKGGIDAGQTETTEKGKKVIESKSSVSSESKRP